MINTVIKPAFHKNKFGNAQIGTLVWSTIWGYGVIVGKDDMNKKVIVTFNVGVTMSFNFDGRWGNKDMYPALYYSDTAVRFKAFEAVPECSCLEDVLRMFLEPVGPEDTSWYYFEFDTKWTVKHLIIEADSSGADLCVAGQYFKASPHLQMIANILNARNIAETSFRELLQNF